MFEMIFITFYLQYELEQLKAKLEKLEKERNEYKTQSEKMENRVSVIGWCEMCKSLTTLQCEEVAVIVKFQWNACCTIWNSIFFSIFVSLKLSDIRMLMTHPIDIVSY